MIKKIIIAACLFFALAAPAHAAEKIEYEGVKLGDTYAAMEEKLGESIVDTTHHAGGKKVVYYMYKHNDVAVGIDAASGKVCDIIISDKDYVLGNGIRFGATPHKILKEYGACAKRRINKLTYYVYEAEEGKIYFEVNEGYLTKLRFTSLDLENDGE
jgi:hypothetical protein